MPIYLHKNGIQQGPFSTDQIREMLVGREVSLETLAKSNEQADWAPVWQVLGIPVKSRRYAANAAKAATGRQPAGFPASPVRKRRPYSYGLEGVGGWLLLFCIHLAILEPLWTSLTFVGSLQEKFGLQASTPASLQKWLQYQSVGSAVVTVFGFIVGFSIWQGALIGKKLARRYLIARVAITLITQGMAIFLLHDLPPNERSIYLSKAAFTSALALAYFLVWWQYFAKSIRVYNTYRRALG